MKRHTLSLVVFLLATRVVYGAPQEGGPILLKGNIQCQGTVMLGGPAKLPQIVSLSPNSGPVGTAVTILGSNFGASRGPSTVYLSGRDIISVTSWSAASIGIVIPSWAPTGPVAVVVSVNNLGSNAVVFTATPPVPTITGLSLLAGPVGTAVTIYGAAFGTAQGTSTVALNGLTFDSQYVTSWSATSIGALIPNGATTGNFVVTVGGVASNGVAFTVTAGSATAITGVSPGGGPVGTLVTISGTNLGSSGTVTFNGVIAPCTNWNSRTVVVAVPSIQPGPSVIYLTTGANVSNPAPFTATSGPDIGSLSLNTGPAGMGFVIKGAGFTGGPNGGKTPTVGIGGVAASVVVFDDQNITVQAPPTTPGGAVAAGGPVVVTVGGIASTNNPTFSGVQPFGCGN